MSVLDSQQGQEQVRNFIEIGEGNISRVYLDSERIPSVESMDVSISISFTDFTVKNDFFARFPKI